MIIALIKPSLIDLEARKRVTGRKAKSQRERLSERGAKQNSACDSLTSGITKEARERNSKKFLPLERVSNKVDGGFSSENKNYLEWNGKPWVADKDCPQRIFLLPDKYIEKYVLTEMQFADETGSINTRVAA